VGSDPEGGQNPVVPEDRHQGGPEDRHPGGPEETPAAYIPLPAAHHHPGSAAGRVFDEVAADYDAARPGYPAAAIERLAAACELSGSSRVLEIGCGTGQATRALADLGCAIRCLEPGRRLAAIARRNLATWPKVEVVETAFETADEPAGAYDAVVSATAFHWIDPRRSYAGAARLLRPSGHLALLTNTHSAGGSEDDIAEELQAVHARLAPELGGWRFPTVERIVASAHAGGDIAALWTRIDRRLADPPAVGRLFEPPLVTTEPWLARYDTAAYRAMLGTQSSYALMDPDRRRALLDAVGRLVDRRLGGTVTKQYVCVLAIAQRRH